MDLVDLGTGLLTLAMTILFGAALFTGGLGVLDIILFSLITLGFLAMSTQLLIVPLVGKAGEWKESRTLNMNEAKTA